MPNRILKESVCTSAKINELSDFNFRLWAYLITYVDDYGRGDARPAVIKGRCFPLRDRTTVKDIDSGLHVLADTGCVSLYTVDGEPYLCFPNWSKHQSIRNKKSKYPGPDQADAPIKTFDSNCMQMNSIECKCSRNPIQSNPIQSESESESKVDTTCVQDGNTLETEPSVTSVTNVTNKNNSTYPGTEGSTKRFTPPTVEEVRAYAVEKSLQMDAERFVDFYASKGWKVGSSPMKDWKAAVRNWAARDRTGSALQTKVVQEQRYEQRPNTENRSITGTPEWMIKAREEGLI